MNKKLKAELRKSVGTVAVDTVKEIEATTTRLCKRIWFHTTKLGKLLVVGQFVRDNDTVAEVIHDFTAEVK